jgi:hypothetical protein
VGSSDITVLSSGNYLVDSPTWNGTRGAVTWGSGTAGVSGVISAANSLVGSDPGDYVGYYVTVLSSGNYLAGSWSWSGYRGAVTWGSGTAGVSGVVSAANSLVGSSPNDYVGYYVTDLGGGNYLVRSPYWNGYRGAVTWGSGTAGVSGVVSAANSLVGSNPNDGVGAPDSNGDPDITVLSSGNYLVRSRQWNGYRGAVTWGSGTAGVSGVVSAANSLVGSSPGDDVGSLTTGTSGITVLSDGNYVVDSPDWNGRRGAVTWGSGTAGVSGTISAANSLVGSNPNDSVGTLNNFGSSGISVLSNGNYVVDSPFWSGNRGAVTWGSGTAGVSGVVSAANSLVGSNPNDSVGAFNTVFSGITVLSDGNYLVSSSFWNGRRGAVTWGSGTTGQTLDGQSVITPQNSLLGRAPNAGLGSLVLDPGQQSFLVPFLSDGGGRVTVGLTDPNQLSYARAQGQTVTITPDFLTRTLDTGTAVVLQASNDITVNDPIVVHAGGHGGDLTLQAGHSIILNAGITTDNGALTLIANDTVADGVVNGQRDPGSAFITMAGGTALDTGTGALTIELRDGAGLTNHGSRAINLQAVTAGSVSVVNNGPDAGSDVRLGPVTTTGPQTYSSPNGVTIVTDDLSAGASNITFTDSVRVSNGVHVGAGSGTVVFSGGGTQTVQGGDGTLFSNLIHNGVGTLQLAGPLAVTGTLVQSAGTFDANDQPVTVGQTAIVTAGTYLAGTGVQSFGRGLVLTDGVFTSSTGPVTVVGGASLFGGSFDATGTVDALTVVRGEVAPGAGTLTVGGAVAFDLLTTFSVTLNGSDPASYSQVAAGGPIDVGGSTLNLVLGYTPAVGDSFTILTTSDPSPINGTFAGLAEGAVFAQGSNLFQITYQGGPNGNGVVLTCVA